MLENEKQNDCIDAKKIAQYRKTKSYKNIIHCYAKLSSTNDKAKEFAMKGAEEGTLVVADSQSAGKGRRGRSWSSEKGVGIYMSMLLRPKVPAKQVSGVTLLGALAVAKAVRKICDVKAEIKWPNDVIVAKKKICGILTEMSGEDETVHHVIIGIGINVNHVCFPEELEETATSIFQETGKRISRNKLIAAVADAFEGYYQMFIQAKNLSFVLEQYNEVLVNKGKQVKIYHGMIEEAKEEQIETGVARGIDEDGALLVEQKGILKRIVAGEVSVRGMYGYVS